MQTRQAARLILLNPDQRMLLFNYQDPVAVDPARPNLLRYWVAVGGGVQTGEAFADAARRELWEETAITDAAIGPWVWTRERVIMLAGQATLAHEHYLLAHVATEAVSLEHMEPQERTTFRGYRWWSIAEMRAAPFEIFLPPGLPDLLELLIAGDLPASPILLTK